MKWNDLTQEERHHMLFAMRIDGGGFVYALSEAWSRADSHNAQRLFEAFPEVVAKYGPGSSSFQRVADHYNKDRQ